MVRYGINVPSAPVLIISNEKNNSAIQATVSESDINKIATGQKVEISFNAIPQKKYTGKIVQFDSYGTNTGRSIVYNIFISINNPDSQIRTNMSANLAIKVEKKDK